MLIDRVSTEYGCTFHPIKRKVRNRSPPRKMPATQLRVRALVWSNNRYGWLTLFRIVSVWDTRCSTSQLCNGGFECHRFVRSYAAGELPHLRQGLDLFFITMICDGSKWCDQDRRIFTTLCIITAVNLSMEDCDCGDTVCWELVLPRQQLLSKVERSKDHH